MELANIKAIITVLKNLNKPAGAEEIAFRVRSTRSRVEEQLAMLIEVNLVKEDHGMYSLVETVKTTTIEAIY